MNDQSRTYGQMTLPGFDEFIGSPASVAGSTLCSLPDGQKIDQSGPEAVHVSPIRVPVNKKAKRTNETCGQKCSGSSASVALSASLANKCRTLLDTVGSIEFRQTWKEKATPLGRSYWEHTASGRRTKETGSIGVPCSPIPTPDHHRHGEIQDEAKLLNRIRQAASNGADKRQANLEDVAMLFPLATPTTRDWPDGKASEETMNANSRPLNEQAVMLMDWGTPQASWSEAGARSRSGDRKDELLTPGLVSDWGTPTAHERTFAPRQVDHGIQLANQVHGMIIASSPVKTGNSVVLAGEFSRWLQGFPEAWDKASPNYDEWSRVQELIESDD